METQQAPLEDNPLIQTMQERGKNPEAHQNFGMFEVINYKPYDGDTKHMWDPNNPDEVEAAKTMFETFKKKGYAIFLVDKVGDQGDQVREFSANAGKYIFVPPMKGG